jgi:hypothetical protein
MVRGKHRRSECDGPAVTFSDPETGRIKREEYAHEGEYHRLGGPALIEYFPDGSRRTESWYRHGVRHRDPLDGPACIIKFDDGVQFEEYLVNGQLHRDPAIGPAGITRSATGDVLHRSWWVNGEAHSDPARAPAHSGCKDNSMPELSERPKRH